MSLARVTHVPIRPEILLETVAGDENGAALLFLGVVRDHADGRSVSGMRYEAYEPMALRVLEDIVREAEAAFDVTAVAAVHRIGELELGDASLGIAVSSPHRDAAYAASRHVLEEIKKRVPVWKHEHFADGASEWVAGTPLEPA